MLYVAVDKDKCFKATAFRKKPIISGIKVMQVVTELPKDLVSYSYDQTTKVLYGLTEEHIDQILFQWKEAQLNGFLKNDIWLNPKEARKLFFKP